VTRKKPNSFKAMKTSHKSHSGGAIWYVVIAAVIAIAGGVFFYGNRAAEASAVDPDTLCPRSSGPTSIAVILIDLTDPLTETQRLQLRENLNKEITQAEIGTLFSLGVVSDDAEKLGSQIAVCKPQSEIDANGLIQNPTDIGRRYQQKFLLPLNSALDEMMTASEAKQSPIMESLQRLVATTPSFLTFSGPRKLILVSDLLQNSDVLSFYRGDDWEFFRSSKHFERLAKTLDDAAVSIYAIPRPSVHKVDSAVVEDFWARYFDFEGSRPPSFERLGDL
jgi:hypothetical protein